MRAQRLHHTLEHSPLLDMQYQQKKIKNLKLKHNGHHYG